MSNIYRELYEKENVRLLARTYNDPVLPMNRLDQPVSASAISMIRAFAVKIIKQMVMGVIYSSLISPLYFLVEAKGPNSFDNLNESDFIISTEFIETYRPKTISSRMDSSDIVPPNAPTGLRKK